MGINPLPARLELAVDGVVGLAEILAAFEWPMMTCVTRAVSMPGEISPVKAPSFSQCTFCAPMATFDPRGRFDRGLQIDERRANDDFVACVPGDQGQEIGEKSTGLFGRLVHLPVGGDELFSFH